MRIYIIPAFLLFGLSAATQPIDSVKISKGVVYKYSSPAIVENARALILDELGDNPSYKLNGGILFIGPSLWRRYKMIPELEKIEGGNVTINYNKEKLPAKMTQDKEAFRKVWDNIRKEVKPKDVQIRKATAGEIDYYWSVISFDITEPLLIVQTAEHRFILNLSDKDLTLVWLDEIPVNVK